MAFVPLKPVQKWSGRWRWISGITDNGFSKFVTEDTLRFEGEFELDPAEWTYARIIEAPEELPGKLITNAAGTETKASVLVRALLIRRFDVTGLFSPRAVGSLRAHVCVELKPFEMRRSFKEIELWRVQRLAFMFEAFNDFTGGP
jgi:hypothetical protein